MRSVSPNPPVGGWTEGNALRVIVANLRAVLSDPNHLRARASGERGDEIHSFSDEQIRMLVRNTEELGCGLIMVGGPNSFGAGGWWANWGYFVNSAGGSFFKNVGNRASKKNGAANVAE